MRLAVISCTPRPAAKSNTAKIISVFLEGFSEKGGEAEVYYLADRKAWEAARRAFYENDLVLFAMPLFVEAAPGLFLEFLEGLAPKAYPEGAQRTKAAFLLQGGFAEASQLWCGESYLEQLPAYLNCDYAGTLIKGNMFGVSLVEGKARAGMLAPFRAMGAAFAEKGCFTKEEAAAFAGPAYFSKGFIFFFTLISPLQRLVFRQYAKKLGCRASLKARPYETGRE